MKIINTYNMYIPSEEGEVTLTAILTQDECKQFAVYIGVGSNEFLLKSGMKQSYKNALNYFPMLKEGEYRR